MSLNTPAARFLAAALLLALPRQVAIAQSAPTIAPPSDSAVRAVVDVIQRGDPDARGRLIHQAFSARARTADSARADRYMARLHAQGAPFTVLSTETLTRSRIVKLLSPRTGRVATLMLSTDRQDPTGLGTVDVLENHAASLDSLVWPATRPRGDGAMVRIIDDNLSRLAATGGFSGVVYLRARDSLLYARAIGWADRDDSVANRVNTRFALASMGKMFTAVSILRLVEQGQLRLDDRIADVLPAYPNADRAQRVTIRHLLEHTAGMGDQWSTPRKPVPGLTGSLATVAAVAHPPLLFEPGSRWSYSNEGYGVLAAVIEQVSGMTYRDYLRRELFPRAGMTETVLESGADDIVPRRAVGYRPREDDLLGADAPRGNWSFIVGSVAGGAGGGYSTAGDLARFAAALRDGRLLGAALRDSMWTGRWPIPGYAGQQYGWGSFVQQVGGRTVVGHGGGGTGSGIDVGLRHFTDGSYTIVVLTNMEPPAATQLTKAITELVGSQLGDGNSNGNK